MIIFRQTEVYAGWFDALRDERAIARISARLRRLALGNPGDVRPVGQGVSEMRIDYGPGYRVYYKRTGAEIVLPLCGGDKAARGAISQPRWLSPRWNEDATEDTALGHRRPPQT